MPQPLIINKVIPKTQKAVASAGGFALTKAGMALLLTPTYIALYNLAYPIASIMLLAFNFLKMLLRWVSMVLFDRCSNFSISLIVNPWAERRRTVFSASVSVILPVITHWFTLMSYSMISPVTTLWAVSFPYSYWETVSVHNPPTIYARRGPFRVPWTCN